MAKRRPDSQLTKHPWERDRAEGGDSMCDDGRDTVDHLANQEELKPRVIKQPKSRFSSGATPRAMVPPPPTAEQAFSYGTPAAVTNNTNTSSTPKTGVNGVSGGWFANTPNTPFAGFAGLNGGITPAGSPAPAATGTPAAPQLSPTKNPFAALTPAGNPPGAGLFGNASTPQGTPAPKYLFGTQTPAPAGDKNLEETEKKNPFAAFASTPAPAATTSTTPATRPAADGLFSSGATWSTPTAGGLFGNVPSTANAGLFGSNAKIGEISTEGGVFGKKPEEPMGLFGRKSSDSDTAKTATAAAPFGGLFGSPKPPAALDAPPSSGSSGGISYPALPPVPPATTTPAATTNGASTNSTYPSSVPGLSNIPPPPPNFTPAEVEEYYRLYEIKSLNVTMKKYLDSLDDTADWRDVCRTYCNHYEKILGTKRKDVDGPTARPDTPGQAASSPKRSKTDAVGGAAKLFGDIVDKSLNATQQAKAPEPMVPEPKKVEIDPYVVGDGSGKDKWDQKAKYEFKPPATTSSSAAGGENLPKLAQKPLFEFKPPTAPPAPAEKPAEKPAAPAAPAPSSSSSIFSTAPKSSTPPASNLFGAGGGGPINFSAGGSTGGGLFANLKPAPSLQRDKGEDDEDSPKKLAPGLGLFSSSSTPAAPAFSFGSQQPAQTITPEKSSSGPIFGSATKADQTWQPGTPIKFGPASTGGIFGTGGATTTTAPTSGGLFGSSTFTFGGGNSSGVDSANSSTTSTATSTSGIFGAPSSGPPSFNKFTAPASAPPTATSTAPASNASTPGATTSPDTSKPATPSTETPADTNEPSDAIPTTKVDLSGPGPGEENDEIHFSCPVAVYAKDEKTGKPKKIAVGTSRVLKDKTTGKSRLLVRTEQGKVVVNVWLKKEVEYVVGTAGKTVLVPDFSGGAGPKVYTVRTRDEEQGRGLGKAMEQVKC